MRLDEILSSATKSKSRRRIGRGTGSGHGKTSGRGHKGFGSRSGSSLNLGMEGGQNPMLARIPKRGFSNADFRKQYQVVNVATLQDRFDEGSRVDGAAMAAARVIQDAAKPVKVLGQGDLSKKLTVVANKFSASAREKISQAGGTVEDV